eukprot:TRINITY_DN9535_c0_g1_i1.p1 TRINITY_DN9535_c0_g1~~TRINITY_DN9535_c0_g1_i1.p1  ORF type:complete len:301 (-),score=59.09 TRINITY_DN9535_c0_g1_i1:19-921(-)
MSSNLICYGSQSKLCILKRTHFYETGSMDIDSVVNIHHGARVHCVGWSSLTTSQTDLRPYAANYIALCTGGSDFNGRYISGDSSEGINVEMINLNHSSYINDIAINPSSPNLVVSVSDDFTGSIVDLETNSLLKTFFMKSPGMKVKCHKDHGDMILFGEQNGKISLYDMREDKTVLHFYSDGQLQDVDWCTDSSKIGSVSNDQWNIWTIQNNYNYTFQSHPAISNNRFKWSKTDPNVFITSDSVSTISLYHQNVIDVPSTIHLGTSSRFVNFSWLADSPYLIGGTGSKVVFWGFGNSNLQ